MINEPVAWTNQQELDKYNPIIGERKYSIHFPIPLYTHPVKELTEQAEKDIRHAISCYFDDSTIYGYELSNRIIAILRKAQE